jgi:hypothetical protein
MIDKPLYGNPLAGGGGTLDRLSNKIRGGLSFRQEGDMGRYVADNDPGGIAAGYSNLKDYLAAGNKLPEFANPGPLKAFENPALASSIIGNGIYDMDTYGMLLPGAPGTSILNVTPPSVPVSEQTPIPGIIDNLRPKSDDPLMQGYYDSDFYERASTTNVVPYTYQGKEMSGSGSYASNFKKYLESIGKGDLIQFPDQEIAQQGSGPLATVGPNVGNEIVPYNPDAGPGVGLDGKPLLDGSANPYNRVGQQLTGSNQNNNVLETLKNIEKGIASLSLNYGQGNNMNQSSNYGNFDNFGIGNFYPPYGGMYG